MNTTIELGKVCKFLNGGTPTRENPSYFEGDIPWITGADITSFLIRKVRSFITERAIKDSATNLVPAGTVLLVTRTSVGKVAVAGMPLCFSQDITAIQNDEKHLDKSFLIYFLKTKEPYFKQSARGATIGGITREVVSQVEIPLPSLDEQKRIAAILNKADRLRRQRRFAQTLSDSFLQSVFIKMFGDSVKNIQGFKQVPLDEISEVKGGLQLSSVRDNLLLKKPYLRVANVFRNELNLSEIKFIGLTEAEFKSVQLMKGDILIVEGHGNVNEIGRCAIWDDSIENCVHQNHLIRVRANSQHISEIYLARYVNFIGRKYFTKSSHTTSGLNTISTGIVKRCPVLLPPLPLQKKFTKIVKKFERVRRQQREAARQAEHLFQTLLHRAFRGEL